MFHRRFFTLVITSLLIASITAPLSREEVNYWCGKCGNTLTITWCGLGGKEPCTVPLAGRCLMQFDRDGHKECSGCGTLFLRPDMSNVSHNHGPSQDSQKPHSQKPGSSHTAQ
ncbi:hypothetical protein PGT21_021544 [Puccinia graminis f. sp. tritici]|uniref:Uncharacterized protein n=1 Tax=Puccinia graminis f. sp. tritici TaxID=56615 RepID=A0A5B0Q3C0_PUCGR|nr:hypothetical protein PGT21_021544 [Puccinia graminis f. sp. tritici]